jgi:hypothetical protein
MKTIVKRLARDEKGAVLLLALILLLVGGLISAALLGHMGAGLLAGEVYGRRTVELYAADAGVENAIWGIQSNNLTFEDNHAHIGPITVNDRTVQVDIYREDLDPTCGEDFRYQIISTAASADGGNTAAIVSATTVEAYVSALSMNFTTLLDHAIVSYDTIDIQPGNLVDGDVWLPINDEEHLDIHDPADITGEVLDKEDVELTWPTAEQLSAYYLDDVDPSNPYPYNSIDITYTKNIGPCYIEGDFVVDNTGDPDTLVLDGTVYINDNNDNTGNLYFEQSGTSHNYTVDLNGHTIFAEGGIYFPSNVVAVAGPGCIIAVGDINFQPSIAGDDFVLVMSITGRTYFHPSGDFTGCIAGNTEVQLQPGCTIKWISSEGKGLDFPGAEGGEEPPPESIMNIETWEIIQQ